MDQILQHITQRVDSFKADQDFQLELLKADLVAYVESKCASLVASSSSTSTSVGPSGSIPQPPTSLVVPQPANSVAQSIDSLAQQPTALIQQPSDHNSTTHSQNATLFVNAKQSDPQTVPNCTVAQSTNAPSSSSEVVASTSNLPEKPQQQQQQQSNVTREGEVKIEVKEEDFDDDDENVCRCDDLAHNLAPNGPPSTSKALSNGTSTSASSQRSSKSGCTRKRPLSVNKHHHHRSNKTPALTAQVDEEDDDESDDDETNNDDDNDSDYEVEEEGDENDEEESDDEVDSDRVAEDENGDEEDEDEEENQQQDRPAAQVITRSLRCPRSNCPVTELAPGRQLTAHMRTAHSILAYACAVRGCAQSFSGPRALGHHIVHSHQSISKWYCSQCSHHFPSYKLLVNHKHYQHQLGHFECAFHGCTFRGQYKRKVVDHYVQQHKRTFKCGQSGCQYETPSAANLKQHERTHSGIKPYRCTWPGCRYAATKQSHAIRHIRRLHLERNRGTGSDDAQLGDPKDFLKVMHHLLK